jgi:hypothetical protein
MRRTAMYFIAAAMAAAPAWAQLRESPYRKHHLSAGLGVAVPRTLLDRHFGPAVAWSFGYGYRPLRYLQADITWDSSFRAAGIRDFITIGGMPVEIRDFQFFIPMGGRVVAPLAGGRIEIYGGGGAVYMRYSERIRQPYRFVNIACPVCVIRDGWGYYSLLGGSVAITRSQNLRLGVITRVFEGRTDGPMFGTLPPSRSSDRWVNTFFTLTLSL